MFGWAKKKDARAQAGKLPRLLQGYPPFTPRHVALNIATQGSNAPVLTESQARENLDQYRDSLPSRLALLRPVLAGIGVDMDAAYSDPLAYVATLHRTLLTELPPLYRPELARQPARELSTRGGADIPLSFMGDLAMLECDVLLRAKPGCFLGLNLDPDDREMANYRRPCLLGLRDAHYAAPPTAFFVESDYFNYYGTMDHPERLAGPDVKLPAGWMRTIGGTLLMRLDRFETHPDLPRLRESTWLAQAA